LSEGGFKARAGALTLLYLSSGMNRSTLLALLVEAATGVRVLDELEIPEPGDSIDLSVLTDAYLVEPVDPDFPPGAPIGPDTLLQPTPAGREVPFVGMVLQRWLDRCPDGSIELDPDSSSALWACMSGWSSSVTHALAAAALTPAEVCEAIQVLDLDSVEARIELMESTGLLEAIPAGEGETRYALTEWLRLSIAPLAAAARMEHRHPREDTAPIAALDVEASFLMTLPLLELSPELSGTCSLAVDLEEGVAGSPTGVTVRVDEGRVVSCEVRLDEDTDAWAAASAAAWLDTVIERDAKLVRSGGDRQLARSLLYGLHEALFGVPVG
jgi:hypothetical protein